MNVDNVDNNGAHEILKRWKHHFYVFSSPLTSSPAVKRGLVSSFDPEAIDVLVALLQNVKKGNVKLSGNWWTTVLKEQKLLENLTSKKVSARKRRNSLKTQKALRYLGLILPELLDSLFPGDKSDGNFEFIQQQDQ